MSSPMSFGAARQPRLLRRRRLYHRVQRRRRVRILALEVRRREAEKAVTWREAEEAIETIERELREEEEEAMREVEANERERFEHREALLLEQQLQEELDAEGPMFAPDYEYEESWADAMDAHFYEA